MKKAIVFFLLIFLGCKKETINKPNNENLNTILDLSNYKTSQRSINDSIIEYTGYNDKLLIIGKYNKQFSHKIGWWNVYNTSNKEKYVSIQVFMEGKTEHKNQVLFYNFDKIDTTKSKLYKLKFIYNNKKIQKAIYDFYIPESNFIVKNKEFAYGILIDDKIIEQKKINCLSRNKTHHYCEIELSRYANEKNVIIGGLFSEYSYNEKSKEMGINEIFTQDTIK